MVERRDVLKLGAGVALAGTVESALAESRQDAEPNVFIAPITGGQEVPPVDTNAGGVATFAVGERDGVLHYTLLVQNAKNVTTARLHVGEPDENGPVVAWLYPAPELRSPQLVAGRFDGVLAEGLITADDLLGRLENASIADLVDEMADDGTYVNVASVEHGTGLIRGNVATLSEVAAAVAPDGASPETTETTTEEG